MRVFAYFLEAVSAGKQTSVLFVMHGVNRNAEEMFHRSVPPDQGCSRDPLANKHLLPELHNVVLLCRSSQLRCFQHAIRTTSATLARDEGGGRTQHRRVCFLGAFSRGAVCTQAPRCQKQRSGDVIWHAAKTLSSSVSSAAAAATMGSTAAVPNADNAKFLHAAGRNEESCTATPTGRVVVAAVDAQRHISRVTTDS